MHVRGQGVTEEGVEMSAVDLIRNFVHEHFATEVTQRRVYADHWLPMERATVAAMATTALATTPAPSADPALGKEAEEGGGFTFTANANAACEAAFATALAHLQQQDGGHRATSASTTAANAGTDSGSTTPCVPITCP